MTRLAIVILNWNGISFLKKFLPGLIKTSDLPGVEIIIADNDSSDGSTDFIRSQFPSVRVIELDQNYGFAGGYNKALELIEASYFLLLNSDIEVSQGWLEPLIEFMDQNMEIAGCSPMILDYNNKNRYEYAGAAGGYIDKFGYTFCRGRLFNTIENFDKTMELPVEIFWTTGACMLIRSEEFRKVSGFDAHFFAHMEEVDLCWRLKNLGCKFAMVPLSKVFHVGGGTLPKSNPFKTYLNFRNNLLMLYKNLPENRLKMLLCTRMLMDGLSAGLFLASFKFRDIGAIIKAHKSYRSDRNKYILFRKEQQSLHGYPEHLDIYQRSLVLDYFLSGRKTFGRLKNGYAEKMNANKILKS